MPVDSLVELYNTKLGTAKQTKALRIESTF